MSKPITFTFFANAKAIGNPTYPRPIKATVDSFFTILENIFMSHLFKLNLFNQV